MSQWCLLILTQSSQFSLSTFNEMYKSLDVKVFIYHNFIIFIFIFVYFYLP